MTAFVLSAALVMAGVDGSAWEMSNVHAVERATRVAITVQVGPPPETLPLRPSAPSWSSCPEWFATALESGWPVEQWPVVDRVMFCESRCEPKAYNRSGASGLMQIMPGWHHGRDAFDPATNLTMALEVWHRQGWRAWSCF